MISQKNQSLILKHKLISLNLKKNRKRSKTPNNSLINNLENPDEKNLNPNNFSFEEKEKKENTENNLLNLLSQLKKQNQILKETVAQNINVNITNNKINFSFEKPSEIIKKTNQLEKENYEKNLQNDFFDFDNKGFDSLLINDETNNNKQNNIISDFNVNKKLNSTEEEIKKLREENEEKERIIKEHEEKEKKRLEEEEKKKKENQEREKLLKEIEEKNKIIKEQEEREKLEREIREKIEKELKEKEEREKIEKKKKKK